ncbi:MAG: non-heme iron oxygenase ferredoxin subunit [Acidimicrobiales bacterium]|jgi:3-phenylpropionate/trans-cinnamate dioxygenase ferredoxin subunit
MSADTGAVPMSIVVCNEGDLAVGEARRFDVGDHRLAIVRGQDCWFAINDECSHADFSLAEGDVDLDDCTIECWKHGSFFSLRTGAAETLPAIGAVAVYPVVVENGEVLVSIQTPNTGDTGVPT